MTEVHLRKRHRLRRKEISAIANRIDAAFGTKSFDEDDTVDMAEGPGFDAVLVDGKVLAVVVDGEPFLTVRGLLRYGATKRFVTVDMGAVKFIANGADVMSPGIVSADPVIAEGDPVWIRDERNERPMAVGRALVPGPAMAGKDKGKAVKSIHYVGDRIWLLDEATEA
jgi:PUA-domain protein